MSRSIGRIETRQPFAEDVLDGESEDGQFDLTDEPQIISFRDAKYESAEMKQLLSLTEPDVIAPIGSGDVSYKSSKVIPEWVLKNPNWKNTAKVSEEAHTVPDILKLDKTKRNGDQISIVVKWLMSVWKIAFTMGFERCSKMLNALEYVTYQAGEHIIEEGKRGLTFYIIISGETHVHKEGIGIVGQLGQGKGFGEVALTQGNDLRTATVTAVTNVECARLHKDNFDYYVRDIQDQEKRDNFRVLSECKLFKSWPKGKIEKMSNSCIRKTLDAGEYVFQQGDPPTDLCVIVEGNVNIVKELVIVCKNRWPVGVKEWKERTKKIHKPIHLKTLGVSDFFGEVAILKDQPRSTSAIAANRLVLLSLDRLEFLHLISYGTSSMSGTSIDEEDKRFNEIISKYIDDRDILDSVTYFRGGPDSQAVVGDQYVYKHDLETGKDGMRKAPPPGASKSVVLVGPTSHNTEHKQTYNKLPRKPRKAGPGAPPGGAVDVDSADMDLTLEQQLARRQHKDNVADKIKSAAAMGVRSEKLRIDRLKSMGMSVPSGATAVQVPGKRGSTASPTSGSKFRKGSMIDQNGLIYKKSAVAAARRGSLSFATRRDSLQGVDNDPTFVYDPIVLLRRNSAIQLGKVYEHVQRHLTDALAGADPGSAGMGRGFFGGSRSTKLSPLRRQSAMGQPQSPPHLDALQLMSQWNSYVDNGIPTSGASRKTRFNLPSPGGGLNSGSRKRSNASGFGGGGANPAIFGQGSPPSNSSIAAAIAQAVAFANGAGGGAGDVRRSISAPGEISASTKNRAPFSSKASHTLWEEQPEGGEDGFGFDDHDFGGSVKFGQRKGSQGTIARDTSLKLLNKAKISYREVMEG